MTIRRIAPLLLLLVLTGCSFFSKSQSRFYSLDRVAPAAPAVNVHGLPVGIDGVELPPGLDRREIVVRKADHQLDVRSNEQWSASLQPLVLHTLAFDLAARLPEGMMILPGEAKPSGAMRSIDVVLEELAAGPDPKVVLDARWVVQESGRPDVARHEQIVVDIASLDSANIANGVSQALGMLADRMAAQLAGIFSQSRLKHSQLSHVESPSPPAVFAGGEGADRRMRGANTRYARSTGADPRPH